jgi:transcriptional regulator with XRE-family HTH domain
VIGVFRKGLINPFLWSIKILPFSLIIPFLVGMSYFTTQLQMALSRCEMSRVQLAEKSGLNYGTVTNYATGRHQPDKDAMRCLCAALPSHEAAFLLCERLKDIVPEEHADLVIVEPRLGSSVLEEPQATYGEKPLPPKLEEAIRKLRAAVVRSPEWADIVTDFAKVL